LKKKKTLLRPTLRKKKKLLDQTQANFVRGEEGTKNPNQKSKTQYLF